LERRYGRRSKWAPVQVPRLLQYVWLVLIGILLLAPGIMVLLPKPSEASITFKSAASGTDIHIEYKGDPTDVYRLRKIVNSINEAKKP